MSSFQTRHYRYSFTFCAKISHHNEVVSCLFVAVSALSSKTFTNFTLGIKDPIVFHVPEICNQAKLVHTVRPRFNEPMSVSIYRYPYNN